MICCDKAALTGDVRVSRVEERAPSFPARTLSGALRKTDRRRVYDIFVIMLLDARALPLQLPLVTNDRESVFIMRIRFHHTPTILC